MVTYRVGLFVPWRSGLLIVSQHSQCPLDRNYLLCHNVSVIDLTGVLNNCAAWNVTQLAGKLAFLEKASVVSLDGDNDGNLCRVPQFI